MSRKVLAFMICIASSMVGVGYVDTQFLIHMRVGHVCCPCGVKLKKNLQCVVNTM